MSTATVVSPAIHDLSDMDFQRLYDMVQLEAMDRQRNYDRIDKAVPDTSKLAKITWKEAQAPVHSHVFSAKDKYCHICGASRESMKVTVR